MCNQDYKGDKMDELEKRKKEAESEAEAETCAECGGKDGKHKEAAEKPEDEDIGDMSDDEKEEIRKLRRKKKEAEAGKPESGHAPGEESYAAGNTISPGMGVPSKPQHIIVPTSQVAGGRMATGTTPGQESYSGKEFNPEFYKSPVGLAMKALEFRMKGLEENNNKLQMELTKRLVESSTLSATQDNVGPETLIKTIKENTYTEPTDRFSD